MHSDFFIDLLVVILYPILHSLLASLKSKRLFSRWLPSHLYRLVYSLVSALYLLLAGSIWRNVPIAIWQIHGKWSYFMIGIGVVGWFTYAYSHLMYYDVGGVFGTSQFFSKYSYAHSPRFDFSTNGLKAFVRFPVHTAFIPMFWGTPKMTVSTLMFSIIGSLYAWLGTLHHDYRYTKHFGEPYAEYKENTGMVFPRLKKYNKVIYDGTPRLETVKPVILLTILLAPFWFVIAYYHNFFRDNIYVALPILTCALLFLCGILTTLFEKKYRYTNDPETNRKVHERQSFTMGMVGFLFIWGIYITNYFTTYEQFSLIPTISVWVLGQISGNFGCYLVNRILGKDVTIHSEEVSV